MAVVAHLSRGRLGCAWMFSIALETAREPRRSRRWRHGQPGRVERDRWQAGQGALMMFIEDRGQSAYGVRFQVRGDGHTLWLGDDALWGTLLEAPEMEAPQLGGGGSSRRVNITLQAAVGPSVGLWRTSPQIIAQQMGPDDTPHSARVCS